MSDLIGSGISERAAAWQRIDELEKENAELKAESSDRLRYLAESVNPYVEKLEFQLAEAQKKAEPYEKALKTISFASWDEMEIDRDSIVLRRAVQISKQALEGKE